ncbi:MAG TPA: YggT family protein [Actinobacteria bacterium]|nr:YggT family protein [Actinomycetota bacterium]
MIGLAEQKEEPDWRSQDTGRHLQAVEEKQGSGRQSSSQHKLTRFINYAFVIVESLILFRIFLKVFGSNPENAFVAMIYRLTDPFVSPFLSAFNLRPTRFGLGVIEFGAILAIAFFVLLNYAITKLIGILASRP